VLLIKVGIILMGGGNWQEWDWGKPQEGGFVLEIFGTKK